MAPKITKQAAAAAAMDSTISQTPPVEAPADANAVVPTVVAEAASEDASPADDEDAAAKDLGTSPLDVALANALSMFNAQIGQYQVILNSAKAGMALTKTAFKDLVRNIKLGNKKARKMNPRNKGPHGLSVQVGISPEMEAFLGVEPGTKMSRPEVGRAISMYCINHGLRGEDPDSGKKKDNRILRTDDVLSKLLSEVPEGNKLHYFNLQHYIKHHFIKAAAPADVAAATA